MSEGIIYSINGPIVKAKGMEKSAMLDLVEVGNDMLIGEIISFEGENATIQVYEDNSGMKPGEKVKSRNMPISIALGPGLLGTIYDGIQRPLVRLEELSGSFMKRGEKVTPLRSDIKWKIDSLKKAGDNVIAGAVLFEFEETDLIKHRIMVPPGINGKLTWIAEPGEYSINDEVYRITDEVEGEYKGTLYHYWPARNPRPVKERVLVEKPLLTGQRIIDTFYPIAKGGSCAIPGGFGTGKTMTQHALAKWSDADIIVYIGCGERGNEMTDVLNEFPKLIDPETGKSLMDRTVLIANTSNMPVAAREISIYTGITIAEYYRDMGYDVAVMADSTSRWAEALRELSGRLEEMPAEEGFPAYLPSRLAGFYERAGAIITCNGDHGSVSIIGAVSPPGGDFSEPVTQHTRRFIRCFWALDRQLANARHYPAISWLDSYSEYIDDIEEWWIRIDPDWRSLRDSALSLLHREDRLQQIVKLVGPDALPDSQRLVLLTADLIKTGFLQQSQFDELDMYSTPDKQIAILKLITSFYSKALDILERGAPLVRISKLSILDEIRRMKSTIKNEDHQGFDEIFRKMNRQLDEAGETYV